MKDRVISEEITRFFLDIVEFCDLHAMGGH